VNGNKASSAVLPWQSETWMRLSRQIEEETLPHALLMVGPANIGKNQLAYALARRLLCQTPVEGHHCENCHACALSGAGTHGDFRWLQPEEKSRVIKIDQIREVIEFGVKTASFGPRKVIVFSPAESMNSNASNALLKALEEPAENTFSILVSHRLQGLSATIRSRTQLLRLPKPAMKQSLDWLDGTTRKREDSERLLQIANGCPMLAQQIFEEGDYEAAAAIPLALDGLLTGRVSVPAVAALLGKLSIEDALVQLTLYLQALVFKAAQKGDMADNVQRVFAILDNVARLREAVAVGSNPNPQLLIESLLAKLNKELGRAQA